MVPGADSGRVRTAGSALRFGIIDRVAIFVAPLIRAGLPAIEGLKPSGIRRAIGLDSMAVHPVGRDLLIEAQPLKRVMS